MKTIDVRIGWESDGVLNGCHVAGALHGMYPDDNFTVAELPPQGKQPAAPAAPAVEKKKRNGYQTFIIMKKKLTDACTMENVNTGKQRHAHPARSY